MDLLRLATHSRGHDITAPQNGTVALRAGEGRAGEEGDCLGGRLGARSKPLVGHAVVLLHPGRPHLGVVVEAPIVELEVPVADVRALA